MSQTFQGTNLAVGVYAGARREDGGDNRKVQLTFDGSIFVGAGVVQLEKADARELRDLLNSLTLLWTPLKDELPPIGIPVLVLLHGGNQPFEAWRHSDHPEQITCQMGARYSFEAVEGWMAMPEVRR
jgi:hypothetical protein